MQQAFQLTGEDEALISEKSAGQDSNDDQGSIAKCELRVEGMTCSACVQVGALSHSYHRKLTVS